MTDTFANRRRPFLLLLFFSLALNILPAYAQPKAVLSENVFNLGSIKEGIYVPHAFQIKNQGREQLQVKVAKLSCACLAIEGSREISLVPGAEAKVRFVYDSSGRSGEVDEYILLRTNDPENKVISYAISGEVELPPLVISGKFGTLDWGFMAFSGLVDGLNPCAFAILVFFISFLTARGTGRQRILLIGISFLAASFLTYLALGLGIFKVLQKLLIFRLISSILYLGIALLAVVLGFFSLYDAWTYKRTRDFNRLKLKLPLLLRDKVQNLVGVPDKLSGRVGGTKIIITSFALGLAVTLLESVCTGQVYLPVIAVLLNLPGLRLKAFLALAVYNLMFILPLSVVFILLFLESGSERLYAFNLRHLVKVKLLTAAVFFTAGTILLLLRR